MKDPTPVAVCSRSFSRHPILRAEMAARYGDIRFNDEGLSLSGGELVVFLEGRQQAIVALETIDGEILDALPDLKVISKYGVGLDKLDMQAMARHRVRLGWTSGVNRSSVAELVIAFAIALLRAVPQANAEVRAGTWRQIVGRQLSDRVVGIIGCGHVGKDVGRLLRAFGCRVLAHDVLDFPDFYAETGVAPASLETLFGEADVVTLHLPLDDSTRNMLNRERLALLKADAILINTARGEIVDEAALKEALFGGRIAGAAFDVFAIEPPEDADLLNHPNFIATPHIGGSTQEAILAMGRAAIEGLTSAEVPSPDDSFWPR